MKLCQNDQLLVMESLNEYIAQCTKGKKPVVNLVIKRVGEGIKPLDGMYLRTMEEALDYSAKRNPHLSGSLMKIKTMIQSKREQFQYSSVKRLFQEIS